MTKIKRLFQKVSTFLHPQLTATLCAARNVRNGQKDSELLRIAMRFYMLSWNGNVISGENRALERKKQIDNFYDRFSSPNSQYDLIKSCEWLLDELLVAGKKGVVYTPSESDKQLAKQKGISLYDEADTFNGSVQFLRRLRKAAYNPWLFSFVYSKD